MEVKIVTMNLDKCRERMMGCCKTKIWRKGKVETKGMWWMHLIKKNKKIKKVLK